MAITEKMLARKDGPIGWMTFNNPEQRNAMSAEMWDAVIEIVADFDADPDIRVLVLAGAGGKAFVSGIDISQLDQIRANAEQVGHHNGVAERAGVALSAVVKPTIAMIQGYCIGGGVGIALRCDLRIAAEGSKFGIPAAKLGVGYGYPGAKMLTDAIGPARAKDLFFTARQLDASEALHIGLVNHVVPAADLESFTRNYAATIAGNAPLTVKTAKLAVNAAIADAGRRDLGTIESSVDACFASEDYKEGRRAFTEKRPARFSGR